MPDLTNEEAFELSDDVYDSGLAFGPTILERLLLAIIKASPTGDGKTDQQRLNVAMKALVGHKSSPNPAPGDRDDRALFFMASEYHKDKGNLSIFFITRRLKPNEPMIEPAKLRSDTALAELAADRFFNIPNEGARLATVNRLREKFSGSYQRKQGKDPRIDYRATYIYRAVEHDYVEDTLEAEGLKRLCDELAEWGVPTEL